MLMSRSKFLCVGVLHLCAVLNLLLVASFPAEAADDKPVVLIVGDSLSAGYGVKVTETWVALLERRLAAQGYGYRVANASVSGETTGGARTRLPRGLEVHKPAIVIIELGGNDGLRGLPLRQIRANFEFMITSAQASGAQVMLIGMRMPANYGATYADQFHALFGELGKKYSVPVVEFFLEGVAQNSKLMQQDGIHPTAAAQELLLDNVWPVLKTVLKR